MGNAIGYHGRYKKYTTNELNQELGKLQIEKTELGQKLDDKSQYCDVYAVNYELGVVNDKIHVIEKILATRPLTT